MECGFGVNGISPLGDLTRKSLIHEGQHVWEVKELELESTGLNESFAQLSLNGKTSRILKMQWADEARKTTEAGFLRKIKDMPGVPKLIAEHRGAKTKDFGNPNVDIVRIHLKNQAHTQPIYLLIAMKLQEKPLIVSKSNPSYHHSILMATFLANGAGF